MAPGDHNAPPPPFSRKGSGVGLFTQDILTQRKKKNCLENPHKIIFPSRWYLPNFSLGPVS